MTGRMRVLCVDDDASSRALLRGLLAGECDVQEAATGAAALQLLPHVRPDVVLLDLMMPGVDGYETCRRIRAADRGRDCKIVVVSSCSEPADRLRGYEAGADDFVAKPFHGDELRAKVRVFGRLHAIEVLDRMKDDLLAILAHELRTPLTGILPAGEVLAGPEAMTESARRMWGEIVAHNGRRLSQLVERGILLCGLRGGQRPLRPAVLDLAEELREASAEAADLAHARGCRLELAPLVPCAIVADGELLAQALGGLIDSALQAVPEGATVGVMLATIGARPRVLLSMPRVGGGAALHARLGGVRVRQADGQMVGADLGLALAEEFAAASGGRVDFVSEGSAACYVLELPTAPAAAPATGNPPGSPGRA